MLWRLTRRAVLQGRQQRNVLNESSGVFACYQSNGAISNRVRNANFLNYGCKGSLVPVLSKRQNSLYRTKVAFGIPNSQNYFDLFKQMIRLMLLQFRGFKELLQVYKRRKPNLILGVQRESTKPFADFVVVFIYLEISDKIVSISNQLSFYVESAQNNFLLVNANKLTKYF